MIDVLLDTNVLLDLIAKRDPFYDDACSVVALGEIGRIRSHVAAISVTNAYYIARVPSGAAPASVFLSLIRGIANIIACDDALLLDAATIGLNDLEDGIQAASARRAGAQWIVTRNMSDFARSPVAAIKPADLLNLLREA